MSYPMRLLKNVSGNWAEKNASTTEQEQQYRAEGYKTEEELWPTNKRKVKP